MVLVLHFVVFEDSLPAYFAFAVLQNLEHEGI